MPNLIDLKERIALADGFTPEERTFILNAVNAAAEAVELVSSRTAHNLFKERLELFGHLGAVLGLLELVRGRRDMPPEIADVLKTNHRAVEASMFYAEFAPPGDDDE